MIRNDRALLEKLVSKYGKTNLIKKVNEIYGKEYHYNVAFSDFRDEEGLPMTVECVVDARYSREFEKFLKFAQDNYIYNAMGLDNDFAL